VLLLLYTYYLINSHNFEVVCPNPIFHIRSLSLVTLLAEGREGQSDQSGGFQGRPSLGTAPVEAV
jgi:hypothetical protein